jgi:hypothetical protein
MASETFPMSMSHVMGLLTFILYMDFFPMSRWTCTMFKQTIAMTSPEEHLPYTWIFFTFLWILSSCSERLYHVLWCMYHVHGGLYHCPYQYIRLQFMGDNYHVQWDFIMQWGTFIMSWRIVNFRYIYLYHVLEDFYHV